MVRIALGVEYDGTDYNGWQKQIEPASIQTIQKVLEEKISQIADERISIICAGRTDAKVHATGQIVHFDYDNNRKKTRNSNAWIIGVNSLLPRTISVTWAKEVSDDFHARFSAISRRYQYYIYCQPYSRPLLHNKALWVYKKLDVHSMQKACDYLKGKQDFSAFRSSECQAKNPVRDIMFAEVKVINNFIVVDIKANAFLHHMVRNIVGCLIQIGLKNKPIDWMQEIILSKDRTEAAKTIAAHGLYLIDVEYPSLFNITKNTIYPFEN